MPPLATGLLVDVLGFFTGAVLYVMLVALVWREQAAAGRGSQRGRLPLLTGLCGLVWNLGALLTLGIGALGLGRPEPIVVAVSFGALGLLPAVVVHSLFEGRERAAGRGLTQVTVSAAYGLSVIALLMHVAAAVDARPVPSRPALWLLTVGFTVLAAWVLLVTRGQPVGRRGIWVVALSIFAVSALHFGRHDTDEAWWIELIGHHASLPLALAILHQDYRFAFADLFLKNALAFLALMGVALALFAGPAVPLFAWRTASGPLDPRAIVLLVLMWVATAMAFPLIRRGAAWVVDRAVLRRPNYSQQLFTLGESIAAAQTEAAALDHAARALCGALGVPESPVVSDATPDADRRVVLTGAAARSATDSGAAAVAVLRLLTVEAPHLAFVLGPLGGGRRLLSDDLGWLEAVAHLTARRLDSLRVAEERADRQMREQQMQRLAAEAELRALRAQLNPHFLFNALTTIGYLIQTTPSAALTTLLRLTGLLRGILHRSDREFSRLGDELDLITSYLDIERARFEERLAVELDVDAALCDLMLPTLLLQPLVENAVKHGLAPLRHGGTLRVRATRADDELSIVVSDDGVGFNAAAASDGVGLTNVRQRLRVHYGGAASLTILSAPGTGTTVLVKVPATEDASPAGPWPTPLGARQ